MHVLGHHHIACYIQTVTLSHPFQSIFKQAPCRDRGKIRAALIATECNKMEIARKLIALEPFGHGGDCNGIIKNCKRLLTEELYI